MSRYGRWATPITFEQYGEACADLARYPNYGEGDAAELAYLVVALAGEAGEVANEFKKSIRDDRLGYQGRCITPERREKMLLEMGDVEWYMNRLAAALRSSHQEVLQMNVDKLDMRMFDDALHGNKRAAKIWDVRLKRRQRDGLWLPVPLGEDE